VADFQSGYPRRHLDLALNRRCTFPKVMQRLRYRPAFGFVYFRLAGFADRLFTNCVVSVRKPMLRFRLFKQSIGWQSRCFCLRGQQTCSSKPVRTLVGIADYFRAPRHRHRTGLIPCGPAPVPSKTGALLAIALQGRARWFWDMECQISLRG